jgi:hypothetical protein
MITIHGLKHVETDEPVECSCGSKERKTPDQISLESAIEDLLNIQGQVRAIQRANRFADKPQSVAPLMIENALRTGQAIAFILDELYAMRYGKRSIVYGFLKPDAPQRAPGSDAGSNNGDGGGS